jgi:2',3'-cyclic-nucleotide 2'-phosphodiesterase/3'-nucleotidase
MFFSAVIYLILSLFFVSCSPGNVREITIIATTDIHGFLLPYDFIEKKPLNSSLAHASTWFRELREKKGDFILLDNGDNLQGQPQVYYFNFIDTASPHIMPAALNFAGYDAATVGNHDIEAGHPVYDRLAKEYKFPLLAANAVKKGSGEPYFDPYCIIEKKGIRVAVLGLVTPSIPDWLPPELYDGMIFTDMLSAAKKWIPIILKEKPDLVVGLFHSGWDTSDLESTLHEDGSASVAYNVPGFDIIFNGHDHKTTNEKFINRAGDTLLILNGGSRGEKLAQADVVIVSGRRKDNRKTLSGKIINTDGFEPDPAFTEKFTDSYNTVYEYVSEVIATASAPISTRDSYFGSSAFVDLIHSLQLDLSGADISFTAPLSFDVRIDEGEITVADMFKLYRYENMLYTLEMTGEEIKNYLEYSYSGWLNTMEGPGDLLLKLRVGKDGKPELINGKAWLLNLPYNFDSAAGIDYIVDVRKKEGNRVVISSFSDGRSFSESERYLVAVNSYRASGGGGHFPEGAGLAREEISARLRSSTDRDLRYHIMKYLREKKQIKPAALDNWKIVPEEWVGPAAIRERKLLFGSTN